MIIAGFFKTETYMMVRRIATTIRGYSIYRLWHNVIPKRIIGL